MRCVCGGVRMCVPLHYWRLTVGEKPAKLICLMSQWQPHRMSLAFKDDDFTVKQVLLVKRQLHYSREPTARPPAVSGAIFILLIESFSFILRFLFLSHFIFCLSWTSASAIYTYTHISRHVLCVVIGRTCLKNIYTVSGLGVQQMIVFIMD